MLSTADQRVERLHRRTDLAVPAGMFDFLDSKHFAAASVAAITAVLCFVSGLGGDIGMLIIPPSVALIYWLMFRQD
jgi:hypothetical protein